MKINYFILIFFCVIFVSFSNDTHFSISPNAKVVSKAQADKINDFSAFILNKTENDLTLHWRLLENTLVDGWDYSICNYGQCIIGIPQAGKMKTIKNKEKGFLNLHVNPFKIKGTGKVSFYIFEKGNEKSGDTLTYLISSID